MRTFSNHMKQIHVYRQPQPQRHISHQLQQRERGLQICPYASLPTIQADLTDEERKNDNPIHPLSSAPLSQIATDVLPSQSEVQQYSGHRIGREKLTFQAQPMSKQESNNNASDEPHQYSPV